MSNVSTVYKMYYKTKGFKPSKTQHLLQFGKSVHIKVKWSEANQLMKKGVTYLNSLLTADELQNITLPQEEKIQTINIKVTDGMTDYYIIKNLTLNSTIEDICSKLEPRLQQSAVKINLYRCNTLLPRSQTISQLNLRDGDSISLGVCDTSIGMDLFQSNYEITINENNSPSPDAITNVSTTNSISEQEDGTDLSVGNECITGECIELINDLLMIFDV